VRARPADIDPRALKSELKAGWRLSDLRLRHRPVGGGSHHWLATDGAGTRRFVTVDDLDRKPWFGVGRQPAFDGLRGSYSTALALGRGGLEFVVPPEPDASGASLRRHGDRYTIAVFPFLDGRRLGRFAIPESERVRVVELLARLHRAKPSDSVPRRPTGNPQLAAIDVALRELQSHWDAGPYGETARTWLRRSAAALARMRAEHARLLEGAGSRPRVVTHGEPHAGNLLLAGRELSLVDWDTVAMAPPERDLWLAAGDDAGLWRVYRDRTGHRVSPEAIRMYSLAWRLDDVAAFLGALRMPHERNGDTEHAVRALHRITLG